ncbi:hypothetical protein [Paenibacillus odorifer]|uniref:hypothetical protein n=1 Tax=Paenibacillus odorifer TaxID=189426 RepID=UPI00096D0DE9|nr:hypothetical protein [Paenibacillus odorifer]OMD67627.1 hypothetical protein BSK50_30115 [Paenibacillus odorifer]
MNNIGSGLQSIENVRQEFETVYPVTHFMRKLEFKMWLNHSESRHLNNNMPFTFNNYVSHLRNSDYAEQVRLNMINVDDLGGKNKVLLKLEPLVNSR